MNAAELVRDSTNLTLSLFGSSITYKVITDGVYNPTTGTVTPTSVSHNIKGRLKRFTTQELTQNLGQAGDFECVISGDVPFTPKAGDEIVWKTKTYRVINFREHIVSDTQTRIKLHVRAV
jgi:hypothetical protein